MISEDGVCKDVFKINTFVPSRCLSAYVDAFLMFSPTVHHAFVTLPAQDFKLHDSIADSSLPLPVPVERSHSNPPYWAGGLLQVRVLRRSPAPHVVLQDSADHGLQLPLTRKIMKKKSVKNVIHMCVDKL